ncbi:MAG: penicillin-binding transpeptidase domain-containing protein, partial [Cyanobacteria bacterium P01_F01_bin.3]
FDDSSEANVPVLEPNVANTMVSMMQGAVQGGTGRSASIGLGEGGKTGTTNDGVDIWFIGFVPRSAVVTSVWLGNDDNTPTYNTSDKAARVWGSYMGRLLQ